MGDGETAQIATRTVNILFLATYIAIKFNREGSHFWREGINIQKISVFLPPVIDSICNLNSLICNINTLLL